MVQLTIGMTDREKYNLCFMAMLRGQLVRLQGADQQGLVVRLRRRFVAIVSPDENLDDINIFVDLDPIRFGEIDEVEIIA